MSQDPLALLPTYGPWLIGVSAFLSCLMIPVPTSFLLLSAGALSGTGHLHHLPILVAAAAIGATFGDLAAYLLARRIEPWLNRPGSAATTALSRARSFVTRHGAAAVFLSRWLMTPLGPATSYVAGLSGLPLPRFLVASAVGETFWAIISLGLGHVFGRQFRQAESAALKAVTVAAGLALILWLLGRLWHKRNRDPI